MAIMKVGAKSSCQKECDFGWTTNGNNNRTGELCVPCDSSCQGCADTGVVGDFKRCLACNPLFKYQDLVTG